MFDIYGEIKTCLRLWEDITKKVPEHEKENNRKDTVLRKEKDS